MDETISYKTFATEDVTLLLTILNECMATSQSAAVNEKLKKASTLLRRPIGSGTLGPIPRTTTTASDEVSE